MDTTNAANLIDYATVERVFGIKRSSLRYWVSVKRVPHVRLGPRTVRFRRDELQRWLETHRVAAEEAADCA